MNSKNPTYRLTKSQTDELRSLWKSLELTIAHDSFSFVIMKLGRDEAKLSKNQLYRIGITLTGLGVERLPLWMLDLLDQT